ncbi:hypothetical protein V8V91_08550 [Algoriphagus halophilus]|uniref:hypothetical protein n=1 Tax=Algoriphagus halophilus TaxID=226505 RepID=UPI00358EC530
MNFKIKAHYGKGIYIFKNEVTGDGKENKVPLSLNDEAYKPIKDFFILSDIENLQQGIISDFEWWNWCVVELIPNAANNQILYANRIPTINARMGLQDKQSGKIKEIYVSGEFGGKKEPVKTDSIPIIDRRKIFLDKPFAGGKTVHVAKQSSIDRQYYPLPAWQSNNKFLNLSLEISTWILSNINNSINIKYHITYPSSYFEKICPRANYNLEEDWIAAIKAEKASLFAAIDEVLSGSANVGKYFHSAFDVDPRYPDRKLGFEIKVIDIQTNHEAYLPAFDTSAAAIANAHNAPLDLVGLSLSKGFGGGSGSNIRESFNFYMQLHTEVPRQTTLEWLYLVKKINGWPEEVEFGYRNIVFQSVNENKSGYAVENESTPTTDQK